jgi:hypothetical protein
MWQVAHFALKRPSPWAETKFENATKPSVSAAKAIDLIRLSV